MVVYDVDPKISSVEDIRAFLKASDCKMIVFPPVTETQDNLRLLRYSIPELFDCEFKSLLYQYLTALSSRADSKPIIVWTVKINLHILIKYHTSKRFQIQTISDNISALNISKTSDT